MQTAKCFYSVINFKDGGWENVSLSDLEKQNEFKSKFKVYSFRDGVENMEVKAIYCLQNKSQFCFHYTQVVYITFKENIH